jgi:hypothetical protein
LDGQCYMSKIQRLVRALEAGFADYHPEAFHAMGLSVHLGDDAYKELASWFVEQLADVHRGRMFCGDAEGVLREGVMVGSVPVFRASDYVPAPRRSVYAEALMVVEVLKEVRAFQGDPPLSLVLAALEKLEDLER